MNLYIEIEKTGEKRRTELVQVTVDCCVSAKNQGILFFEKDLIWDLNGGIKSKAYSVFRVKRINHYLNVSFLIDGFSCSATIACFIHDHRLDYFIVEYNSSNGNIFCHLDPDFDEMTNASFMMFDFEHYEHMIWNSKEIGKKASHEVLGDKPFYYTEDNDLFLVGNGFKQWLDGQEKFKSQTF